MRMLQASRRPGLVLEALELRGVQGGHERQYLESDLALEGNLLGLEDDAHAAPAGLTQ